MIPGLWRCGSVDFADLAGILAHPIGLLLIFGAAGLLRTFRRREAADIAWRLFVVLALTDLGGAVLILLAALITRALNADPTAIVEGGQYLGSAIAWVVTIVVVVRERRRWVSTERLASRTEDLAYTPTVREFLAVAAKLFLILGIESALILNLAVFAFMTMSAFTTPGFGFLSFAIAIFGGITAFALFHQKRRAKRMGRSENMSFRLAAIAPAPVLAVFVAAFGVFHLSTGPIFHRDSVLSIVAWPYQITRWFFELNTAAAATDECLAHRAVELPPPPLLGKLGVESHSEEQAPYDGTRHGDFLGRGPVWFWDPATSANTEIARRKASASPGVLRVLTRVLERGNHEEQERARWLLLTLAREHGDHPLLEAWGTSPANPAAQPDVRMWLVCVQKNRRDLINWDDQSRLSASREVDENCVSRKERTQTANRTESERAEARRRLTEQACIARGRRDLIGQEVDDQCRTAEEQKAERWRQWVDGGGT